MATKGGGYTKTTSVPRPSAMSKSSHCWWQRVSAKVLEMLSSSAATKTALRVPNKHGHGYPRTMGAAGPPGEDAGSSCMPGTTSLHVLGALRVAQGYPGRWWRVGCLVLLSVSWEDHHLPGRGCEASPDGAVPLGCGCSNICPSTCELFK